MSQILETCSIVSVRAPIDTNGSALNSNCINVGKGDRVIFLLSIGNIAGDLTVTVEECATAAAGSNVARAFDYYKASAGAVAKSILDGAKTAATSAGITIANAADDNKIIAIVVKGDDLTEGKPYVRLATTNPAAACLISEVAILEGTRFKSIPSGMNDPTT